MVVDLRIDKLVQGGDGLALLDGLAVFVPFAAPQDRIRAQLVLRKKDYAVARILEVVEPSPLRVTPPCRYYGDCGGCQLQHLDYAAQLAAKKLYVSETLQRVGKVFAPVQDVSDAGEPWRYRNKTQYPVAGSGRFRVGFFRRASHDLLDIETCLLHAEEFDRLRVSVIEAASAGRETGYIESSHTGNIRHVVLRQAAPGAGIVVTVVTRTDSVSASFIESVAALPGVSGVVHNFNPDRTNRILGRRSRILAGTTETTYSVLGRPLRASAGSFFQVNLRQAEELCRKVLGFAAAQGDETVVDLYSGAGMLSLLLAERVANVVGVEIERSAVADAIYNAGVLGARNLEFIADDVDRAIERITRADIVVLDPPRKGCTRETLSAVCRLKPSRIVYVSCNPATLARDLRLLDEMGYSTRDVEPVDMFPQTFHVEVVALLTRSSA